MIGRCGCVAVGCDCLLEAGNDILITGSGIEGDPFVIDSLSSSHTHDGTGGATSLVVGGVNEAGATVPIASSLQSIAIGDFANAGTAVGPIAIGSGLNITSAPSATGQGAIALGASNGAAILGARAQGTCAVAIGSGTASVIGASAPAAGAIAIGRQSQATQTQNVAIGASAVATGLTSTALGSAATASAAASNAIGPASTASGVDSLAIGTSALASVLRGLAIGAQSVASTGNGAIALGAGESATAAPSATAQGAIAIGASNGAAILGATAEAVSAIAIGSGTAGERGARAAAAGAISIGSVSRGVLADDIAIGRNAIAQTGISAIAIGGSDTANSGALALNGGAIAIGASTVSTTGALASGLASIAIGGSSGVAAEEGASAQSDRAIAIGSGARATAVQAVAVGRLADAAHANAVALGDGVATTATVQVNTGVKRIIQGGPNTAPADANLVNSQISFWYDEAGSTLSFKVKSSAGVVKNGTVVVA